MEVKRKILLNPGPATTTDSVKMAQVVSDICPREQEFAELVEFITEELTVFVGDPKDYVTVLFGGSGTAVVESMISSAVTGPLLVINNGAYGKRMCQIAEIYNLNYVEYKHSPVKELDLDHLKKYIMDSKLKFSHLAMVHHETTTGMLNDLEGVGKICQALGIELIVDGVSSYAAVPIDMKKMNISFLASTSNKNIQGMPGCGFVIAKKNSLDRLKDSKARNLYLSLYDQHSFFQQKKQLRFTPPVQTFYALKQAIIETKREGVEARYLRYSKSWQTLVKGLAELGLELLLPENCQGKLITTIIEPANDNYSFEKMHDYLYDKDITIYPGKLFEQNTFRVANIGAIDFRDIEIFLKELKSYLVSIGHIR